MSFSMTGAFAVASVEAVDSTPAAAATPPQKTVAAPPEPTAENPPYVVQLTDCQQAQQLNQQGEQVSEIAYKLDLTTTAVKSYLGINNTK